MIVVQAGPLGDPAARLLAAAAARGVSVHADASTLPAGDAPVTLAVSDGPFVFDLLSSVRSLDGRRFRLRVL